MDDGLPPKDDAAAPRLPSSGRPAQPRDPRREDGRSTPGRKQASRAGRQPIDPLLAGGHPAAQRPNKQRLQPPVDPFEGQPLSIRNDPTLDLPTTPRAATPAPKAAPPAEDLDALLDRGPVTLPAIVPAEQVDAPDTSEEEVVPVLPVLPLVTPAVVGAWSPASTFDADQPAEPHHLAAPHHQRVRRVTRVIRHVDAWSVFKVAVVFNLFLYVVTLTSGVLLWQVAQNTGTVDNIERFFENFGWKSFTLHGGEIFHNAWVAGLFLVVGMTGFAVLMATLFNLITDLVGGIRVSVLEEEVVARDAGSGSSLGRRWQHLRHRS